MKTPKTSSASKSRKRVFLVDDHPIVRQGLAQLINNEPDLCVSGEAANVGEALAGIASREPDLVLADISLPGRNGLELIKDLQTLHPRLPVLVISMHDELLYVERVLRAGGRGYIMKQEGGRKLLEAVRQVLGGQIYVSERMSAKLLEVFSGRRSEASVSLLELLTDREFEIFQLFGKGMSTREVAVQLHVSVKTIEVHRLNIKKKLGLKTANELIRHAVQWVETQDNRV